MGDDGSACLGQRLKRLRYSGFADIERCYAVRQCVHRNIGTTLLNAMHHEQNTCNINRHAALLMLSCLVCNMYSTDAF